MDQAREGIWLRTDEYIEAVSALEMAAELLPSVEGDTYRWKWVVISLHNALQGFMVLAVKGSNSLPTLKQKDAERWLLAHRDGGPYPDRQDLDFFFNLFIKIQQDDLLNFVYSKKYVPDGTQICSVKRLNELRNDFIHFRPMGYSLEVSGLPVICVDCLAIIEFLGWHGRNFIWHDDKLCGRGQSALTRAKEKLSRIRDQYEAHALSEPTKGDLSQ